jgi:hypothetical protein
LGGYSVRLQIKEKELIIDFAAVVGNGEPQEIIETKSTAID